MRDDECRDWNKEIGFVFKPSTFTCICMGFQIGTKKTRATEVLEQVNLADENGSQQLSGDNASVWLCACFGKQTFYHPCR
jgi:hypothetical protein